MAFSKHRKRTFKGFAIKDKSRNYYYLIRRETNYKGIVFYYTEWAAQIPKGFKSLPCEIDYFKALQGIFGSKEAACKSLFENYEGVKHIQI